ncbi:uroporphyrinogen decarboxylase family protein [Amphibacillus sp. Q70]|uniref:uroporphyrinogen decarboxylase family protein n=1 Tax=Amphibacillus sp. Q70 TaxID=3453416 RepID=UPI003F83356B
MTLTKKQRFIKTLAGKKADRPLVSAWHHFLTKEQAAGDLAEATISYVRQYDWDWVKINPRATYLAEAFGNRYDLSDYQWVFPRQIEAIIQTPEDLTKISPIACEDSAPLSEQLEAVKLIRQGLPDTPLTQTMFSPLTILMFLAGRQSYADKTMYGSEHPIDLQKLFVTHRSDIHQALRAIALTMKNYVKALEAVGIDGLFYATTGTAHPDLFSLEQFNEFSRPYDEVVLSALKPGGRLLHTCGAYADPERFNDYPIEGISWDPNAEGNPDLTVKLNKVKVAGVDHEIFNTTNAKPVKEQAQSALSMVKGEPFLLVPNCAVSPFASVETLTALKESIE